MSSTPLNSVFHFDIDCKAGSSQQPGIIEHLLSLPVHSIETNHILSRIFVFNLALTDFALTARSQSEPYDFLIV